MRNAVIPVLVALAVATSPVLAAGIAIRWDRCYVDAGTTNRNFACNTNSGTNILVGSFVSPRDIVEMSGTEFVLDLASAGATLPAWWAFKNVGSCRQASLALDFTVPPDAIECVDWASGQASGSVSAYVLPAFGPNTARVVGASSVPVIALSDHFAGVEYFAFRFRINNAKTVGTDACSGCDVPVCLVMQSIKIFTTFARQLDQVLTTPLDGTDSHYATWQGGGSPTTPRGTGCPAATPTRTRTWGGVKALYR